MLIFHWPFQREKKRSKNTTGDAERVQQAEQVNQSLTEARPFYRLQGPLVPKMTASGVML